jgi:hypothetical protein
MTRMTIEEAITLRPTLPEGRVYFPTEEADALAIQMRDAMVTRHTEEAAALQASITALLPAIGITTEDEYLYWRVLKMDVVALRR